VGFLGSAGGETLARILIADDRHSMRTALRAMLRMRSRWEICGEARDGREAVEKAVQLQPDDSIPRQLRLSQQSGISLTQVAQNPLGTELAQKPRRSCVT
jgi:chemotaxis response regulator CheB